MVGDWLVRLGRVATTGDVVWIAVQGPWLAACLRREGTTEVVVWRLAPDLSIGPIAFRHADVRACSAASLARDGRYLAVGLGVEVVVVELERGTVTTFRDHTDRLGLVRFVGDDHLLVTADLDSRVVLRPRTPGGYAQPVMPVALPAEPVALPAEPVALPAGELAGRA